MLIRDRDSRCTGMFEAASAGEGIGILRTPVRAPQAERDSRTMDWNPQPSSTTEVTTTACIAARALLATSRSVRRPDT